MRVPKLLCISSTALCKFEHESFKMAIILCSITHALCNPDIRLELPDAVLLELTRHSSNLVYEMFLAVSHLLFKANMMIKNPRVSSLVDGGF
jgi:hypothetical protein